jgi:hypothetical protein
MCHTANRSSPSCCASRLAATAEPVRVGGVARSGDCSLLNSNPCLTCSGFSILLAGQHMGC